HPVSATRYHSGAAFTAEVTGYDSEYRATGARLTIPETGATAGLAGAYAYGYTYTPTGKLQSTDLPAAPGGLAAEKLITRYSGEDVPITTSGLNWYTGGTDYSPFGEVLRTVSGEAPHRVWSTNVYDPLTGRLDERSTLRETAQNSLLNELHYGYDKTGNVTSIKDVQPGGTEQQCFAYDPMGQLVHAWTGVTDCPTTSTAQGAGPARTGLSPGLNGGGYWQSYEFDAIGNRTKMTVHDLADEALDDTYTYDYGVEIAGGGGLPPAYRQPHALTKVTSTVNSPGSSVTSVSSYGYDLTGNTTTRVIGGDTQTLTWDRANKVESVSGFGNGKGTLINASGKCLDVHGADTADGTPIQLFRCHGAPAQQFQLTGGDTLKALGKCVTADGAGLVLSTCDGSDAQKFTHRPADDSLYHPATGTCVDVPGADYTDGKDLQLHTCNATDPQKWTLGDTTSYLYDANGTRLIETTSSTRTLYLPDAQITVNTSGTALDAQRYYTHPGAPTTVRTTNGKTTGHTLTVLLSDHHNTATTAVDLKDGLPTTRRAYDPYGNPRGTQPTTWPGRQTFLGTGTDDTTTGLTHIGAREYDPTTGRFLSTDPLIDITDPLQMNGYTYANANPTTLSDPTGLRP
ncbi:ricin-type beta-trefoil lectin domain protein, partial [Streptomyces sp. PR69]|uniref:ricin-type beta-trefoil lectin domain protein n=1 Tax=Streptomyces sp. PR69 TaxID=2984950 RepID=UPI00226533BA